MSANIHQVALVNRTTGEVVLGPFGKHRSFAVAERRAEALAHAWNSDLPAPNFEFGRSDRLTHFPNRQMVWEVI